MGAKPAKPIIPQGEVVSIHPVATASKSVVSHISATLFLTNTFNLYAPYDTIGLSESSSVFFGHSF